MWVGTNAGLYRSTDEGLSWEQVEAPQLQSPIVQVLVSGASIHAAGPSGLFTSFDGGTTWEQRYTSEEAAGVYAMASDASGGLFLSVYDTSAAAAIRTVVYSSTAGPLWTNGELGILGYARATSFLLHNNDLYMVAGEGLITYDVLYRWNTSATSWDQVSSFPPSISIAQVVALSDQRWLATTSNGVFASNDNGASWAASGLYPNACGPILVDMAGFVGVGTNTMGPFRSADQGNTWVGVAQGIPENPAQPGAIDPVLSLHQIPSGTIFLGTRGHGIFRLNVSTGIADLGGPALSIKPNPTSDSFSVLGSNALVALLIDAAGRQYRLSRSSPASEFDVSTLPTGVYTVLLKNTDHGIRSSKIAVTP